MFWQKTVVKLLPEGNFLKEIFQTGGPNEKGQVLITNWEGMSKKNLEYQQVMESLTGTGE